MSSAEQLPPAALAGDPAPARIRVCHVMSADLWAGAEVQVATMASYLARRPEVDLSAVLLNEGPLAAELRRLGVPVTVIDERRHGPLGILAALVGRLRGDPADVVHTHRYKDTVLGAVAARLARVPAVVRTVHGRAEPLRGWPWAKFRIYEALERLALRLFADRIVAVSWRMAQELGASGYRPGPIVPIHNGIDLRSVRPLRPRDEVRRELGLTAATELFGTAGRLAPVKGHEVLLRAAPRILGRRPQARFLFVGDGPLRTELALSARRLGIERSCLFAGARSDVHDLVAAMDVFVLPSLGEGIPMALLEAMALERPVVATAVGGVPEIIEHRATGLLVAAGDEAALAEACLELARDAELALALGACARRRVEEAFSHERSGQALLDVYRSLVASAAAPGRPPTGVRLARGAGRLARDTARRIEQQRVERVRRDPSRLLAALRSARRILIVCQGNIIRSPFAARLLARELGAGERVRVSSAGLAAKAGTPPPAAAFSAAARLEVDLAGHAAALLTKDMVVASDLIFVMDVAQLRAIQRLFPDARARTFVLSSLAPDAPLEVRDPYDGDDTAFQACYAHISSCTRPIVRALEGRP